MRGMALFKPGEPLERIERDDPAPGVGEVLIEIAACGVCRTDLHIIDGDLEARKSPIIPGHEIVGYVSRVGADVTDLKEGDRVGVPWLGSTCTVCRYCNADQENLCDDPEFTGWTRDGGFADMALANARYAFPIPGAFEDVEAAPLLCAGLIGHRSWRMAGSPDDIEHLGLYGFGAAAHILVQIARAQGQDVYAFTRPGDETAQAFARKLGCVWAGGSDEAPPRVLDAAIIFAPVGALVPAALQAVRKGGRVVCAGIHMSDIPSFPYRILWEERRIQSVANLTRRDGLEFLPLAAEVGVKTSPVPYPLERANEALDDLRAGRISGAAVLVP